MKRLIAEFEKQSFVQMIFPHEKTDWVEYLEEARENFVAIINAIRKYEQVLLVCADVDEAKRYFEDTNNITFVKYESDDTWARDLSAISVEEDGKVKLYDFIFNAWGGKFEASKDNALTQTIKKQYKCEVVQKEFILEGGAIESNGKGVLLTTAECMFNKNRNQLSKEQIIEKLKNFFGLDEVLYLENGYLAGDDTDSHIDTLARFVSEDTIMYVAPPKEEDEHFKALLKMEKELKDIAKEHNFKLIPLPFCDAVFYENERLPATYANFLMINGAVIVPIYGLKQDKEALEIFREFFKNKDIIGIDCSILIRQHGSLHCVTMQFHCKN